MNPVFLVIGLVGIVAVLIGIKIAVRDNKSPSQAQAAFDRARVTEADGLSRFFLDASRPLAGLPVVNDRESSLFQLVESKIYAAGGAYGGSPQVFMAVQTFAALVGMIFMLLAFAGVTQKLLAVQGMFGLFVAMIPAILVTIFPWYSIDRRARVRQEQISAGLPEFAELLQMPLTAGQTIMAALEFTCQHTTGPVSEEAANVVLMSRTRKVPDAEAFAIAGKRLATPEAEAFFDALMQAHVEGSRVVETLSRQAEALRTAQYQRQREKLKKVPVKLIVIFAMFLLLPLLVLLGFVVVSSLGSL